MSNNISETEQRLMKREALLETGEAYAVSVTRTHSLREIRENFTELGENIVTDTRVSVAGRVMFRRGAGKIAFATLQEGDGTQLQLMLKADVLPEGKAAIKSFSKLVDSGDFVAATGLVATSMNGELSVLVEEWEIVSKGIHSLPFLHSELSDEQRVRQPYAHLIQSQDARNRIRERSKIIQTVRETFQNHDYIEVETPVLQPIHGGALARPFKTNVNAIDQEFSLRIALETNLKKCVVGGLEKVFEIGKVFRNEGVDATHNPEFTMLEAYEAYGDQFSMADRIREVFLNIAENVYGDTIVAVDGENGVNHIDLAGEWKWLPVYDAVSDALSSLIGTEIKVDTSTSVENLREFANTVMVDIDDDWTAGKIVMELCSELVEPALIQPTFLCDFPAEAQPLARRNPTDNGKVLAWDLIVNGTEIGTAFTELVDPVVQREILTEQSIAAANGDEEAMELDNDFLRALEYGMPPSGGIGIGIDRLVMFFTNSNIRESVLFPLLKKEIF